METGAERIAGMSCCEWKNANEALRIYHDQEWGIPVHNDVVMFEHLSLECLQCGLSWELMLRKRSIFRECFDGFDFESIAGYTEEDIERILNTEGMIRSRRKIEAVISNAQHYIAVRGEFGTFCGYIWEFAEGRTILYKGHGTGKLPVSNGLSRIISSDLKKRGFRYVGPVTIYSFLQACGIVNDHGCDCPCYARINAGNPTVRKRPDREVG